MSTSTANQAQAQPIRIQFAPGATSVTIEGKLTQNGEQVKYVFGAQAGQQMTLNVTTSPDGFYVNEVITFANGATDGPIPMPFTTEIPETGDNYITISTNQMASTIYKGNFVLTLEIN
jgi:hypothetical protein